MTPTQLIDHVQVSISVEDIGAWVLDRLKKDSNQNWQFKMWQDEKDGNYLYLLGRVPPPEWDEG